MASHTDLAAVSILAVFAIGSMPATSGEKIVEAKNWNDAISKLDCKDISKNADGSFSLAAVVRINSEEQHNPIVNVPEYKAEIEAKKC
jgi:hypothetical protein